MQQELTGLNGMPEGEFPPRVPWVVVGHEMQPLSVLRNIRESDIQQSLAIEYAAIELISGAAEV